MTSKLHYSHLLQAYIVDGKVQGCNHPADMSTEGPCCHKARIAGMTEEAAEELLVRTTGGVL